MFQQDHRVSTWNELQDQLFAESWNPELGRFRSRFAFRGLSDAGYSLATTLRRLGGGSIAGRRSGVARERC